MRLPSLLTLATAVALPFAAPAVAQDNMSKLVTVITSADAQTQLMGMVLTMQSVKAGASAHMLLCGPGGDLALKDAPDSATAAQPPMGMSPQGLMQKIMEAGGTVEVCAIYLPGKGADASVLLDNVGVAAPPAMAARLMDADARVLSF
jgi:predicted peroxiredoxin